jgi:hypothetical protein
VESGYRVIGDPFGGDKHSALANSHKTMNPNVDTHRRQT